MDGGPKHRAQLDKNVALEKFCSALEKTVITTVENGIMTKDLALLVGPDQKWVSTLDFLEKIDHRLNQSLDF